MRNLNRYTPEQVQFLKKNIHGKSYAEFTEIFNAKFNVKCSKKQINRMANYYGVVQSQNYVPTYKIGGERLLSDGYIYIKVSMDKGRCKNWKQKHRYVWEKANGKILKGKTIIFLDSNRMNCDIENLAMVSRAENIKLTQLGLRSNNRETTLAGIAIVKHLLATHKRLRKKIGKKAHKKFIDDEARKRSRNKKGKALPRIRDTKKVRCIETGVIYSCSKEASLLLGKTPQAVRQGINGIWRVGGYRWEYV
jgi:hypothetical protein